MVERRGSRARGPVEEKSSQLRFIDWEKHSVIEHKKGHTSVIGGSAFFYSQERVACSSACVIYTELMRHATSATVVEMIGIVEFIITGVAV